MKESVSTAPVSAASQSKVAVLEGDLGPRDAAAVHTALLSALQQSAAVEIDARTLASLDTSIIQILVAARKSAERLERPLTILTEPDGALPATLERLGLTASALR